MAATAQFGHILRFGAFEVDTRERELRKKGIRIRLQGQPLEVLILLAEHSGELVTREQLRTALWSTNTFVDFDHSLNNCIARIREALDDAAESPRFIETVPRRGYRFVSPVEHVMGASEQASAKDLPSSDRMEAEEPSGARRRRLALLLACGAIVWAAAALVLVKRSLLHDSAKTPTITSLAVLPLENLSGDASQNYFVDGMTDELITELAKVHNLKVISRTSAMRYKGSTKALPEIARELGVDAIVEGSVVRSGDAIRVTAQLIRASDDRHLWAQDYNRSVSNILQLQNDIAGTIAGEIQLQLDSHQTRTTASLRQVQPEAYEAYLQGQFSLQRRTPVDIERSIELLQRSISQDANFAPAHAALSDAYAHAEKWDLARAAAERALQLDADSAAAHAMLGFISFYHDWNFAVAEKEFRNALSLDPSYANVHRWYGVFEYAMRSPNYLQELRRAQQLDPFSPIINSTLADALQDSGQFDACLETSRAVLNVDPTYATAHITLGLGYKGKRMYSEALSEFRKAKELDPTSVEANVEIAGVYLASGQPALAHKIFTDLSRAKETAAFDFLEFAILAVRVGEVDQAIEALEQDYRRHDPDLVKIGADKAFASLHGDKRFRALVQKIGLPDT